jgi:hypothetical protein
MSGSKTLSHDDQSGFEFAKEMLQSDFTAAINFDRIQKHPTMGYIIFEYLLCDEEQKVTPYSSHPNKYWHKNSRKFISLNQIAKDLNAHLYLVNYAKKSTANEDEVLVIKVLEMDDTGIKKQETTKMTRKTFSDFFRKLNKESLSDRLCKSCGAPMRLIKNSFYGCSEYYHTGCSYTEKK